MTEPGDEPLDSTESAKGECRGEEAPPGSMTPQEERADSLESESGDSAPGIRLAHSATDHERQIAAEIATMVRTHFDGVQLGANLPSDWPRPRYLRVLKAEANWRAGIMSAQDIALVAGVQASTVYEWAKLYLWPKRDDITKLTQASVQRATVLSIAMKAKEAARRLREARESASEAPTSEVPDGVTNLSQERDARPLSDADAQRAVVVEQATAAAAQDAITNMFVEQVSKILQTEQELADFLVEHCTELGKSLKDVWAGYIETNGKKRNGHELIRAEVGKQVQVMRQLIGMSVQAVTLQRRVWLLDQSQGDGRGDTGSGELDMSMPVPTERGTYEDYVRSAEARGEKLNR